MKNKHEKQQKNLIFYRSPGGQLSPDYPISMETNEISLQMAVVPESRLKKLEDGINRIEEILQAKNQKEIDSQWIPSTKIPKLLGISLKTWQTYRDKRIIPFSQIGSKIFVLRADLEKFMQSHYIDSKQ